jgi:hypothetical protein
MRYEDYIFSGTANKLEIDNTPNKDMEARCLLFIDNMVRPLEDLFYPYQIVIHSGYRSPKLNRAVGGQMFSQHLMGNAIDFHVEGMDLEQAFTTIQNSSLWYDQLIIEKNSAGNQWLHCSYNTDKQASQQRKQALRIGVKKH